VFIHKKLICLTAFGLFCQTSLATCARADVNGTIDSQKFIIVPPQNPYSSATFQVEVTFTMPNTDNTSNGFNVNNKVFFIVPQQEPHKFWDQNTAYEVPANTTLPRSFRFGPAQAYNNNTFRSDSELTANGTTFLSKDSLTQKLYY